MSTIEDQDAAIVEATKKQIMPYTAYPDDKWLCMLLVSRLKEYPVKIDFTRWTLSGGKIFDHEKFMSYALKISGVEPAPIQNHEYNFNVAFDRWRSGLCS